MIVAGGAARRGRAADARAGRDARREEPLSSGVNLLDLDAIKGLEFDAAIVVEPRPILAERPDGGLGGLYTALTRSTRALAIVHADPLPAGLAESPDLHVVPAERAAETWSAGRR